MMRIFREITFHSFTGLQKYSDNKKFSNLQQTLQQLRRVDDPEHTPHTATMTLGTKTSP